MNEDELRHLRMQHYWDQQQAAMDEIRRLIAEEAETAIGKVELSDSEIHKLMTQYGDAPIPEWEWAKLIVEAGRPINGPPMMISWVDDDLIEDHTTLSSQLFWFQAGWRASKMRERLRTGDYDLTRANVERILGVINWTLSQKDLDKVGPNEQFALRMVASLGRQFIEALDKLPEDWKLNDEDLEARDAAG